MSVCVCVWARARTRVCVYLFHSLSQVPGREKSQQVTAAMRDEQTTANGLLKSTSVTMRNPPREKSITFLSTLPVSLASLEDFVKTLFSSYNSDKSVSFLDQCINFCSNTEDASASRILPALEDYRSINHRSIL